MSGRVIAFGQSWFASREVVRVPTSRTPGEIGAEQVQRLAADPPPKQPKVVVVDSHFPVPPFLRAFVNLAPRVVLLARLAANRVLYGPPPLPTGKPGRPPTHGAKLALRRPGPPDRQETSRLLGQDVRISAWVNYHARALVQPAYRPWDPPARQDPNRPLTPGPVLAAWQIFSRTLETPAAAPKRAGKAAERAPGERPTPRERHPLAKARKRQAKMAA